MSDKKILQENGTEQKSSAPNVHKRVFSTLLALGVCLVLALFVWIVVMNAEDTSCVTVRIVGPNDMEYELSDTDVEIEGTVAKLKELGVIEIVVPAGTAAGVYRVTDVDLGLPDGVRVVEEWEALLTIKAK
ncbi:MAG: hypothetical protein E7624_08165 [Ruminococcaceae bacterium]|nr:hypothetical protein [Oscillospiraceae bacterium]